MSFLIRIARTPIVTRTHIRLFASADNTDNLPALYKPSKEEAKAATANSTTELEVDVHSQPTPKETPEPKSQSLSHPQYQAYESEEDTSLGKEYLDEAHPDDRPLRPPHGIKLDPENHGLSAFFRKFRQTNAKGQWEWTAVEPKETEKAYSGRSWSAPELRRKSFKDLHTLWYVLLRERNLLATQKEALRRLGVPNIPGQTDLPWKVHQCRKSMARIKYVINERRLAYEGAVERFAKDKALGKIGAVADREAAKERMKGKKPTAAWAQGKGNTGRQLMQTTRKSRNVQAPGSVAPPATVIAPPGLVG